ncbi:MAG TPA: hypothetical protein VHD90_24905 [Phototrophicaceae bacterium]|nr:hypothetical protein [Phototrophicaceae bacterium]
MKKFRLSILLLVLALVLAIVPAVLAQDTLGASQDDYNLWTSANASFATVTTASYSFTAKLAVAGMSDPTENVTANLSGTGAFDKTDPNNPAFQLDVTGSYAQGTQSTNINMGVRITGGNLYYTQDGTNWTGMKLSDAMSSFGQGFAQGAGISPTEVSSEGLSNLMSDPQAQQMMAALSQLKLSDFLTLTRSDNNGKTHFNLNIDIAKLLSSPSFQSMMSTMASSASGEAATEAADAQQQLAMAQMLFSTAKINLDQDVDPSTNMVTETVLDLNVPLDSIMGPGAGVTANFDISFSNYNQPVTVTAPANATMTDTSSGS